MLTRLLFTLSLLCLTPLSALGADHFVFCGKLVDSAAGRVLGEHTIVVSDGVVKDVRKGRHQATGDASFSDLTGYTCLPGLIDSHTHLSYELNPRAYLDRFQLNEADFALRAAAFAAVTLNAGFTTVRDLGDAFNVTIALRKSIDAGLLPGPRVFTAAKSLASTGGHADPTNSFRADMMGTPGPSDGVINGISDAREAVRQRYKDGADVIKITATGGVLSLASSGDNAQFTTEELREIIRVANDYGFAVAAHAHGKKGMQRAVEAGVTSIEHGTYIDDEVIELMKQNGTWLVPTLAAGRFVAEKAQTPGYFPEVVRRKAATIGPIMDGAFQRAYRGGVKIAFGTDSGVSAHGDNAREFGYMVGLGMPPMEAIQSATVSAAELLGQQAFLGQIKPGYAADLIAVDGDLIADITQLEDVDFVMKAGQVYVSP